MNPAELPMIPVIILFLNDLVSYPGPMADRESLHSGRLATIKSAHGGPLITESPAVVNVSDRLKSAVQELRRVDKLLLKGDLDPRILTDFRDAINRVRNTAWSAQQYVSLRGSEQDSQNVISLLAGERIRATYQLCQLLESDLASPEVHFQPGQLLQLYSAVKSLSDRLERAVRDLDSTRTGNPSNR